MKQLLELIIVQCNTARDVPTSAASHAACAFEGVVFNTVSPPDGFVQPEG